MVHGPLEREEGAPAESGKRDRSTILTIKVGSARRRLFLERLLRAFSLDLVIFLSLFLLTVLVEKITAFGLDPLWLFVGVVSAALIFSLGRTFLGGRVAAVEAAKTVDQRLGLKERVSSAVYLHENPAARTNPEWEELVSRDGVRHLKSVDLREHFPLRLPRVSWLVLPILVLTGILLEWMPTYDIFGLEGRRQAEAAVLREVDERKKELDKQLAELEAEAAKKNAEHVKKLVEALRRQQKAGDPPENRKSDRGAGDAKRKAMVSLSKQEEMLQKATGSDRYKKLGKALKELERGSLRNFKRTRELRRALKEGDLKKADKELGELKKDIANLRDKARSRKLTPEEMKKLKELAEELSRLAKDSRSLESLSRSLSQAASSLSQASGSSGSSLDSLLEALDSLQLSKEELEQLAQMADELDMMDEMLELVKLTKEDLAHMKNCPKCGKPRVGQKPGGT